MDPGTETSTFVSAGYAPGLNTLGASLSDSEAMQQDMLRAVTEQEGVLFWAPDKTLDLNEYLEKGMSAADVASLQARIVGLFDDDPRYSRMVAKVALVQGQLSVTMTGTNATGVVAQLQLQQDGTTMRYVRVS